MFESQACALFKREVSGNERLTRRYVLSSLESLVFNVVKIKRDRLAFGAQRPAKAGFNARQVFAGQINGDIASILWPSAVAFSSPLAVS